MNNTGNVMKLVSPAKVLKQIAEAIPADCRENLIIIGSLAAGYHFFGEDANLMVRTKDADCLLSPRVRANPRRDLDYGAVVPGEVAVSPG